ncbi:hypothetical protein J0H33_02375 [bacterium]|jgi:hypothetical protein|nr:hypothetical protein [bacterium]
MPYIYEVWRLVQVKDDNTSTWELIERFPNARRARMHIQQLAGSAVLSSEDNESRYFFDDINGTQMFRIEPVLTND